MTSGPSAGSPVLHPQSPAFAYVIMSGVSLGLVLLVLLQQGHTTLALSLILIVGGAGVLLQLRFAPNVLLILVAISLLERRMAATPDFELEQLAGFGAGDVFLCAAVLGYVASQYRLQGLTRFVIMPYHPQAGTVTSAKPRSTHTVTPVEQALLAISLPFWALAAQLAWLWLARPRSLLEWNTRAVQLTVCAVLLATGLTIASSLLLYCRRRRMTPGEAALLLQDTLWNETRGEQRWFARWLAWSWLRRKERP